MTNFHRQNEALLWLAARGHISGSWARGEAYGDSDIDVRLPPRSLKTLTRLLDEQGVHWRSTVTGHVLWAPEDVYIEVYDGFPRYKPHGATVWVEGVEFRK